MRVRRGREIVDVRLHEGYVYHILVYSGVKARHDGVYGGYVRVDGVGLVGVHGVYCGRYVRSG